MAQLFARFGVLAAAVVVLTAAARPVAADSLPLTPIQKIDSMMVAAAAQSAQDAAAIKRLYRPHLNLLLLNGFADLEGALQTGGLAPLPPHPERFNLAPRLEG